MELREGLKKDILKQLGEIFENEEYSVIYTDQGEESPVDVLSVLLTDIVSEELMGEFFFLAPSSKEESVLSFASLIHITEELPVEVLPLLCIALTELNWEIPYGAYTMRDGNLCYKYTVIIPANYAEEQIREVCETAAAQSVIFGSTFADLLLDLIADHDIENFRSMLEQLKGEENL